MKRNSLILLCLIFVFAALFEVRTTLLYAQDLDYFQNWYTYPLSRFEKENEEK